MVDEVEDDAKARAQAALDAADGHLNAAPKAPGPAFAELDLFHALQMPSFRVDGAHVMVDAHVARITFTEKGGGECNLHAHARASVTMTREAAEGIARHILRCMGNAQDA